MSSDADKAQGRQNQCRVIRSYLWDGFFDYVQLVSFNSFHAIIVSSIRRIQLAA